MSLSSPSVVDLSRKLSKLVAPAVDRHRFIGALISGTLSGFLIILLSFSVAALIFSGRLAPHITTGIGLSLFGSVVLGLVIGLRSRYRGMLASVQQVPGAILALITYAIVAAFPATTSTAEILPTVLAAIALGSILLGVIFWLLARLRLSSLVRFIPYPVIGGLFATTGWVLVVSSFEVCAGVHGFSEWFSADASIYWLPGLGLGLLLFLVSRISRHYLIMPGLLLAGIVVFFLILWLNGISAGEASAAGWLLPIPEQGLLNLMTPADWQQVNWLLLLEQLPAFLVLWALSIIALLLNLSGFELETQRSLDADQELRSAGFAHMLGGLGGAPAGYHALDMSVLSHRLDGDNRLTGIVAMLIVSLPLLLIGSEVVLLFPKFLLGGLLLYLGLDFLYIWLWQAWHRLVLTDYLIIVLILAVGISFGFFTGAGVGLITTLILFVLRYQRISVVKNEFSAAVYHSRLERSAHQRQLLRAHGEMINILQLQGFIFFGTAQQLLDRWLLRINDEQKKLLRYSILDCRLVTGMDSSALLSLGRLLQLSEQHGVQLIVTGLSDDILHMLKTNGLENAVRQFPTLDQAVEWCEEQLLYAIEISRSDNDNGLAGQLRTYLAEDAPVSELLGYFTRREAQAGQMLMRQGESKAEMLVVESGQVTIMLETKEGRSVRIRTMKAGSVVGEMALYANQPRTASVVADTDVVAYSLDRDGLNHLEQMAPELASALHRAMLMLMAERLADTTALVRSLAL